MRRWAILLRPVFLRAPGPDGRRRAGREGLVDEGDLRVRMARLAVTLAGDKDRAHPKARFSNAGVNDIGGLPGGPIDRRHHEEAGWEKLIVALCAVLSRRRLRTVHESRRATEDWATTITALHISNAWRRRRPISLTKRAL